MRPCVLVISLFAASGFSLQLPAQEALPAPLAVPAAPQVAIPSMTVHAQPPAPTMIQSLASARRGVCATIKASPLGKLFAEMRKPLSTLTGGLVPMEKKPHPDEQKQPGPEGTAAQIKTVKLQAPKRQAAIEELTGIDVRYHPEAEAILVTALRADPSECVRFEAARTLTTLPVCSEPISQALKVCVAGNNSDGNPAELSARVRLQAEIALLNCQTCMPPGPADASERPEYPISEVVQASALHPLESLPSLLPISSTLPFNDPMESIQSRQELSPVSFDSGLSDFRPIPSQRVSATNPQLRPSKTVKRPTNLADIIRFSKEP